MEWKLPRSFYWCSGFALCGAFKTAFEGEWNRSIMLLGAVVLG